MKERRTWLRSPRIAVPATAAGLFAWATLVPIVPWQARCYEEPVPGPYRPIFVEEVAAWLARQDVYHWRWDGVILLRILPLFDGNDVFDRGDTILNVNKISDDLENDVTIGGVLYPKPPAVREIEEEQRRSGSYDGFALCRAAIQVSPTDPPLPRDHADP